MKNRKREREQRLTWRSPPSPPARPSPLAPASRPPPLARRTRGAWPAPAATRRPPPASADALEASTSATPTPTSPSLSSHSPRGLSPSLALSPSSCRRSRHRLAAVAAATVVPVSPHRAHELRNISLDLLDEPRGLRRAATPPPLPFPSSATRDRRRQFAASRASPSPFRRPLHSP